MDCVSKPSSCVGGQQSRITILLKSIQYGHSLNFLKQRPLATPHSWLSEKFNFLHRVVMDWLCESQIDSKAIEKAQLKFIKAWSEIKPREAKKLTKSKMSNLDITSLP